MLQRSLRIIYHKIFAEKTFKTPLFWNCGVGWQFLTKLIVDQADEILDALLTFNISMDETTSDQLTRADGYIAPLHAAKHSYPSSFLVSFLVFPLAFLLSFRFAVTHSYPMNRVWSRYCWGPW